MTGLNKRPDSLIIDPEFRLIYGLENTLTGEKRYQIHVLLHTGQNQIQMPPVVGVHKATISRELRRNRGLHGYRPHQAHHLAQARQVTKRRARLAPTTWQQVETLVRQSWSPE